MTSTLKKFIPSDLLRLYEVHNFRHAAFGTPLKCWRADVLRSLQS